MPGHYSTLDKNKVVDSIARGMGNREPTKLNRTSPSSAVRRHLHCIQHGSVEGPGSGGDRRSGHAGFLAATVLSLVHEKPDNTIPEICCFTGKRKPLPGEIPVRRLLLRHDCTRKRMTR